MFKRYIVQAWWRLFGEKCPCGASWRRRGQGKLLSVCCFARVLYQAQDEEFERQHANGDWPRFVRHHP